MKAQFRKVIPAIVFLFALNAAAATRYVDLNSPSPTPPYTNWSTAATNIQEAVDAAGAGDEIVVTNGVYASGGRAVSGTLTNRVAIDKPVLVHSLNGPLVTFITGQPSPGTTNNGGGAIRCVYVGTNAVLSGFTLTNGHTGTDGNHNDPKERYGGGVLCEASGVVTNCTITYNSGGTGGGAYSGTLNNCTLSGNSAGIGGAAYSSKLNNCIVTANSSSIGGGASFGMLNNCTLTGNSASAWGGGAYSVALNNCTLTSNSSASEGGGAYGCVLTNCNLVSNSASSRGGGAYSGTLNKCTLTSNSSGSYGGGADDCTLRNCTLTGNSSLNGGGAYNSKLINCTLTVNSASDIGGGASASTLNNCTLTGNSARNYGGGVNSAQLTNCIVYFNSAGGSPNSINSDYTYSCTTPLPPRTGNIDDDPLLVSATHLSPQSPCNGRGSAQYVSGVDIDGEAWLNPPCMGADQFVAGSATGVLTMTIVATYTNVATGFNVSLVAQNNGPITASSWDFGDGVVVSNSAYASHAWSSPGLYEVRLTGYNDAFPGGVSSTLLVNVSAQEIYYVNGANADPVFPYTNWVRAATNIQDATDAGVQIGRLVLVTNGVYASGGRATSGTMTNRVVLNEGMEVRSANGPLVTFIAGQPAPGTTTNGNGAIRCAYVATSAVLSGFTLTNGHTQTAGNYYAEQSGGGVWCETRGLVTNCILIGNSASYYGGGACYGTLSHCTLIGNSAAQGGGASGSTLSSCTLSSNSASAWGGGAYNVTLNTCTLTNNYGLNGGGASWSTLSNCTLSGNLAYYYNGGGAYYSSLNNCTLSGNIATSGAGAYSGTLNDCTLTSNSSLGEGGGAHSATLNKCILTGNSGNYAGGGAYECTLNTCTLNSNSASLGGGAYYCKMNNCTLAGNSADQGGGAISGGANSGALTNCCFISNSASWYGGGTLGGTLYNCTLTGNSSGYEGGGAHSATLTNCIVYYNNASNGPNYFGGTFVYSCTTPLPPGPGNIANPPSFIVTNAWSNLRLQSNSPCINAGNNAYATNSTDLDGNPRIAGGTVDMGAYEFQGTGLSGFTGWLWQHGLRTDGTVDHADSDGDRMNNWQEWRADTNPTNALSVLRMVNTTNGASGLNVTWQSVSTRSYFLERATNFGDVPPFQTIVTNIAGTSGTKTFTDTSATNSGPYFYRVGVQ